MRGKDSLTAIAKDYFEILAENFPVMCSSDEFYFFPRVEEAERFSNRLDSLDRARIEELTRKVKKLFHSLGRLGPQGELEKKIDADILKRSMKTFLRDFEEIPVWKSDPNLYLRIVLFGLADYFQGRINHLSPGRMEAVPRLLREARENIKDASPVHLEVAQEAVKTGAEFLRIISRKTPALSSLSQKAANALKEFGIFLGGLDGRTDFRQGRDVLKSILQDTYGWQQDLGAVLDMGKKEEKDAGKECKRMARQIHSDKSWLELVDGYRLKLMKGRELLTLYRREVNQLKMFLHDKDIISLPEEESLLILNTPPYLAPLRSSASYCAPLVPGEKALFYVRTFYRDWEAESRNEVHKEYLFISAHETYPGHHLLDLRRRTLSPIRRQIESPLFYEGWASYSEHLIQELGYCEHPVQKLIGKKRQLWRAVRAILDVSIHTGKMSIEEAKSRLIKIGYNSRVSSQQVRHYVLTPGYQFTYMLGKNELLKLRNRLSPYLGLKGFHDFLMDSGEVPFHWIEERYHALSKEERTTRH